MTNPLLNKPLYHSDDLGKPMPDSPHAVSVCLPTWNDIIGYEEKDPRVINAMRLGYPRFVYHPQLRNLFALCENNFATNDEFCIAFPSETIAMQCLTYIKDKSGIIGNIHRYKEIYALTLSEKAQEIAKEFWQHTGLIISSRQAESILTERDVPESNSKKILKQRIASLSGEFVGNVYLFPSGMAAVFAAHQSLSGGTGTSKTIQLGFPYVDTIKVQEKFGAGMHFLKYDDESDLNAVEEIITKEQIAGVFCEFPGNPLLKSINLKKLSEILRPYAIPLIVDDTIATWHNADLIPYADIIVTSLTKFFSGTGDVLAGSLILNSNSPLYDNLKEGLRYEDLLFIEDAIALEKNSLDFSKRMERINKTAETLCDYLKNHTSVAELYYPKYITRQTYDSLKKPTGGYGGLFSIVLKNQAQSPAFYDKLTICKGPSLGTNFTIACPYTLMAHYHELDLAKQFGILPTLIRVSVGLENADDLIGRFEKALK